MPKTMYVLTGKNERLAIPVKRVITLCGIPGFAVHRPVNHTMDGTQNCDWMISHIETGLRCITLPTCTIQEAIERAESSLRKSGYDTPIRFAELVRGLLQVQV